MQDKILNVLPLSETQQQLFLNAASNIKQVFCPAPECKGFWQVPEEVLEDTTILIGNLHPQQVSRCKNIHWLQTWSAGVDAYTKEGVLAKTATITSANGAYGQSVSEHAFSMLLALMKNLPQYVQQQQQTLWQDAGATKSLENARVLILGMGDLGTSFARLCKGVGMRTVGMRRTLSTCPDAFCEQYPIAELETQLMLADIVCMTLPQTPQTIHLMNEKRLRLMPPDAILINVGRGSAIDEDALARVLHSGHLWAAGLDVTQVEPLAKESALWHAPRCFVTPHAAGGNHIPQTQQRILEIALYNLKQYTAQQPLKNRMQ